MKLRELVKVIGYGPIAVLEPHLVGCGAAPEGYYEKVSDLLEDEDILDLEVTGICANTNGEYGDEPILEIGLEGLYELGEAERPYMELAVAEFLAERHASK